MNLRERREFAAGLDTDELWLYILSLLFELARSIGPPHPRESLEYHSDDDAENPQTRIWFSKPRMVNFGCDGWTSTAAGSSCLGHRCDCDVVLLGRARLHSCD